MSATSRLKQLLFLIASLALIAVGLTGLASAAQADDTQPCVETQDSYTDWVNEGPPIRTEENSPPELDGELVRYVFLGETEPEVITPATAGQHYSWVGGDIPEGQVPPVPPAGEWQANTSQEPHENNPIVTWLGAVGSGLHFTGTPGNANWFYFAPGTAEVTDVDYLWQKQVRTFVPGNECGDVEEDCEENPEQEKCDEDDDDEKCPDGSDKAGQEIPSNQSEEEFCDEDDPIIDPGEGEEPGKNPGNNPSSNPGSNSNNPSSNPQGSNLPNNGVTPVSAPGANVPSAVNAGLAPTQDELIGTGNGLGLVGISTVLLGLGLLGLTLRPRRGRKLAG